jgi:glycosyltransferase involved in cell wall biosynthesis
MTNSSAALPKVSIITPAYNASRYLAETIESVLAQTMTDFEMIIVDDGSTDATATIAQDFADRDSRIMLIRRQNAGISASRNLAIQAARGEYIALLDSDDRWMPTFLEAQLSILSRDPTIDAVSCNAINEGGSFHGQLFKHEHLFKHGDIGLRPISLLQMVEVEDAVCILTVFRRRVIAGIGLFNTTLRGNEDYEFWLRAAAAGFTFVFNPTPLGYYRRRPDSVSADQISMLGGIIRVLNDTKPLCDDRPTELQAINRQISRFERQRLFVIAKSALLSGNLDGAAAGFASLNQQFGGPLNALLARFSHWAPRLLIWGYRTKAALRKSLRARRAQQPIRG